MQTTSRASRWGIFCLVLSLGLALGSQGHAEEAEPEVVVLAAAESPQPDVLPTIRVVNYTSDEKPYPTMVAATFPDVPGFQSDSCCWESSMQLEFVDARPLDGGRVEVRHRIVAKPEVLVITTVTPEPGALEFEARMGADTERYPEASMPDSVFGLNMCWQVMHAPNFKSKPDPYPEFIKRCFIFTEKGMTSLLDTNRGLIPTGHFPPDHERQNPPWVQQYAGVWQHIPRMKPGSGAWSSYSTDRYVTTVIGCVSRDGKYLAAIANDSASTMCQAWFDCMHNNPQWLPLDAPTADRRWRVKIYAMENDPDALLARVGKDFPNAKHLHPVEPVPLYEDEE